ncbi:transcriptional repressor [bacterium]|nr:transcriptional repressor [bacterium]
MTKKPTALEARQEIEKRLQEAGIQPTAQRIAIAQYVLTDADHPTADDIKTWADQNFPKMSLATVYNTLKILVQSGILREFKLPHSDRVIYDTNLSHHFHFLDEKTGALHDIPPEELEIKPRNSKNWDIRQVHVVLVGRK